MQMMLETDPDCFFNNSCRPWPSDPLIRSPNLGSTMLHHVRQMFSSSSFAPSYQ